MLARALVATVVALSLAVPSSALAQSPSRYSLAGGCWSLDGERVRLQATALGSYLLYRPDRTFLAAQPGGTVAPADEPSPAADWRVADAGGGQFRLTSASGVRYRGGARVRFVAATGCPTYPEAELNASGTPGKGKTSYGTVGGFIEGHMHWMMTDYLGGNFFCGHASHPYGIPSALPDCSGVEGPQGSAAPVQNFLNFGQPVAPHDTTGWPKLTEWRRDNLTYEGNYWRWVQRGWMGGLRLMIMSVNENRELCQLQGNRRHPCDEMTTVRRGLRSMYELQRYVDAQAGGPGKGFFQIVTSPNETRRVINQGKMAVVLEIEISELFGCRGWDNPTCDRAQVDRQLDEMYRLGVRSSLFLNKFDNPLAGVRFDGGPIGVLINAANRESAGTFWNAETCKGPYRDNTIFSPAPAEVNPLLALFGTTAGGMPSYPPPPHCNTRGLTDLGRHLTRRMMQKQMIINPDHMSQKAVDATLTLAEQNKYSGVISPHGWMDPGNWPRIWKLGGMAFPGHTAAKGYAEEYQQYRPLKTPYLAGWGYGADLGGLSGQPAPSGKISYPFKSYDGKVTLGRQRTGERVFDYNNEGVAHYGLYPDWFEDLRRVGGSRMKSDMWNGAEAYLQMWERASGVPAGDCRARRARVTRRGLGKLRLRRRWETLLRRAGQPQQRNRAWSWCVRGKRNKRRADVAVLTAKSGRVALAGSTARGRSAGGIRVGARVGRLRGVARSIGGRLFVRRAAGRSRFVYYVRRGRVRVVAVATRRLAAGRSRLRAAMRRLRKARAANAKRTYVANPKASGLTGATLSGSQNPKLNQQLALLCQINR